MPDYKNAKIYRIVCNVTGLTYVGSTTRTLAQRLCQHRYHYQRYLSNITDSKTTSFNVLACDDYDIVLLEKVVCESIDELHQRERYYIETLDCVNKRIPLRLKSMSDIFSEAREAYQREYRETNKEAIKAKAVVKIHCGCGSVHNHCNKSLHLKSQKHRHWEAKQAWLAAICA